jgi:hypothetical protein
MTGEDEERYEIGGKTHLKGGTLGLKFGCEDISLNSVSADSASPTLQHAFWKLARERSERIGGAEGVDRRSGGS